MKIIVDAFGGDLAPLENLKGAEMAVKEYGIDIILTGNEKIIRDTAAQNNISLDKMTIYNTEGVITMEDHANSVLKAKRDSSMGVAFDLLAKGEGDALVSAGNTGALLAGATLIVKRIKGILRPALAPLLPTAKNSPVMLLDAGANADCKAEHLAQFAVMGSIYMNKITGIANPKVGLLSNGTEKTKGNLLTKEAYPLLENTNINFIGNIEARDISLGNADVAVADGFTGNAVLKAIEGFGAVILNEMKGIFSKGLKAKVGALLVMDGLKAFKKKVDYTEYGGAIFLGVSKPVIKAHGNSKAKTFKFAIKQACAVVENGVISEIQANLGEENTK